MGERVRVGVRARVGGEGEDEALREGRHAATVV